MKSKYNALEMIFTFKIHLGLIHYKILLKQIFVYKFIWIIFTTKHINKKIIV